MPKITDALRVVVRQSGPADVGSQVGRGALWSLLNNAVLRLGVLASGIVLARLLSPQDYGVFAIALVAMTLLMAFNELGVSLALVRWERDPAEFAGTAMTVSVVTSTVLYIGTYLAAPAYCDLMGSESAVPVLRLLCVAVILDGIAVVPSAILNRLFAQRTRLVCDVGSFVTTTAVTLGAALNDAGAASFAYGRIAGSVVSVVLYLLLCPVRVRPGWDTATARELVRFGLPLAGSSLLVLAVTSVDQIVVGAVSDEATLGFYLMAYNVSSWAVTVLSEAARRVSLAGFARLVGDPARLERSVGRGVGLLAVAVVPLCLLVGLYAEDGLTFVYGPQWAPAAAALELLAVLGILRVLLFVGYDLLVALGRSRLLLCLQAVWLVVLIPALIVATRIDGIRGAALAHVAVAGLLVLPMFALVLRANGLAPTRILAWCGRPAVGGLLVVASAVGVRSLTLSAPLTVLLGAAVAALVYLPVVWPMRELFPRAGKES